MEDRLNKLRALYERIHECRQCGSPEGNDPQWVKRVLERQALNSKIFLVGQALGERTQRVSGRPYIKVDGRLSLSGQNLDKLLRLFGFTVNPFESASGYQYVYSSDLIQCYPGRINLGEVTESQTPEKSSRVSIKASCVKKLN